MPCRPLTSKSRKLIAASSATTKIYMTIVSSTIVPAAAARVAGKWRMTPRLRQNASQMIHSLLSHRKDVQILTV
jgi:hypothetical protein